MFDTTEKKICETCGEPQFVELEGRVFRVSCRCLTEKYEKEEQERQKQLKLKLFKQLQVNASMGEEYLKARFETAIVNEHNKGVYEKAKNYCKNYIQVYKENHGLYIYGDNSSGKTHLSACIANDLMEKDIQVIFTSLGSIIRETFRNDLIYERLARVPFLFLDDLGKEFIGRENDAQKAKYAETVLKNVLDARVNNNKPLIITSNYSMEKLATELKLDRAILERLNVAISREWELTGTNFRDLKLEQKIKKADRLGI
jgi:DNA replication protein DnaC